MDVVILLVFISLCLVAASLVLFVHRFREGDFDHGERLSLAPLDDDEKPGEAAATEAATEAEPETVPAGAGGADPDPSDELEGGTSHARC